METSMKTVKTALTAAVLGAHSTTAYTATIQVPQDQATIQSAVVVIRSTDMSTSSL
jgi:hypothetical protein